MVGHLSPFPTDLSGFYDKSDSDSNSSLLFRHPNLNVEFFDDFGPRHTFHHHARSNEWKKRRKDKICWLGRFLLIMMVVGTFLAIWSVLSWRLRSKGINFLPPLNFTNAEIHKLLISEIDGQRIRRNNRWLSSRVHVAGSQEQLEVMDRVEEEFRSLGFHVRVYEYDVLLSRPDYDRPNRVHALINERWLQLSAGTYRSGTPDLREGHWWNAYTANGTAIGQIVYANFGTWDDFKRLESIGISVVNRIVLIRYGANFRGDKVHLAEKRGASGVILFTDPAEFSTAPEPDNKTYARQNYLPRSETQRGTLLRTNGDPTTPLLPSKSYVHSRLSISRLYKSGVIPRIPVQPISSADAQEIMMLMDGVKVPRSEWQGGMPVTYRLNGTVQFRLEVHAHLENSKIKNVVATWTGAEEPDRQVMLINHVDAWTKGAIDPNSASAILLELARALSRTSQQTGWRPRRSVVFCAFDAEEFGLVGSTEYVEEMLRSLQRKAIAVLNVDNVNGNTTLLVKAVPLVFDVLAKAAAAVSQPNEQERAQGRLTLLESWRFHGGRGTWLSDRAVPAIRSPSTGSDFQPFLSYAGIPAADLRMESMPQGGYAFYHTSFETIESVERLIDPTGAVFVSMGQFWGHAALNLADSQIIPFNVEFYGLMLSEYVRRLGIQLIHLGIDQALGLKSYKQEIESVNEKIAAFRLAAIKLQHAARTVSSSDSRRIDAINDRFLWIERCFLIDQGVSDNPLQRHVIFAPARHRDVFSSVLFPGIIDPSIEWTRESTVNGRALWLEAVLLGFTKLNYAVESATNVMHIDELMS